MDPPQPGRRRRQHRRRAGQLGGHVNAAGLALRQAIEDRTDRLCEKAWRHLGADVTETFCTLVELAGEVLLRRIDETAGPNWMPAARERRS